MQETDLKIARLEIHLLRAPTERPVMSSLGVMTSRPCLLVRVEDAEGAYGWGEVWSNFPTCGPEHRARLLETAVGPALLALPPAPAPVLFEALTRRLHPLALQAGEPGPIAQCIAGLDIALWDLAARRDGVPLARRLGGEARPVPAYASGIDPRRAAEQAAAARAAGYSAFKIKIGFGRDVDLSAVAAAARDRRPGEWLMVDANQAWDLATARDMADRLKEFGLTWLEEPLPADRPWPEWQVLSETGMAFAAGENLRGMPAFEAALASGALRFVQPDMAKWGGFTACLALTQAIAKAGATYCPHYLGGAVGLIASAHLLAASGSRGRLEIDCNPNPLRQEVLGPLPALVDGNFVLPDRPGLGFEPEGEALRRYQVAGAEVLRAS